MTTTAVSTPAGPPVAADGQPGGPGGCGIPAHLCLFCQTPIVPSPRRSVHPRKYCGASCRSKAHQADRQRAILRVSDLLRSLSTTLYCTHVAIADVCLNLDVLSLPRRRQHGADAAFPAAIVLSLSSARDALSRVLAELSPQGGQEEGATDLPQAADAEPPHPREDPDVARPVETVVVDAGDRSGVHPLGPDVALSGTLGGRPVFGDPTDPVAADVSECGQRTGVGE
jgi:hypothetical protein